MPVNRQAEINLSPPPVSGDGRIVARPEERPAAVYLAGVAEGSRRSLYWALAVAAEVLFGTREDLDTLPWHLVRYSHMAALRARIADRLAPVTCNKVLAAVRSVLREAGRLEQIGYDIVHAAGNVKPVKGARLPRGRSLSKDEVRQLQEHLAADLSPVGRRDAAMVSVFYATGMRCAELAALETSDYRVLPDVPGYGVVTIRHGKGNRARRAHLPPPAVKALDAWLSARGKATGPLFVRSLRGGGFGRGLSVAGVGHVLRERGREAGLAPFTPHDFRRTTITHLLEAGVDLAVVSRLVGHSSVMTTMKYDRRKEKDDFAAIARLYVND